MHIMIWDRAAFAKDRDLPSLGQILCNLSDGRHEGAPRVVFLFKRAGSVGWTDCLANAARKAERKDGFFNVMLGLCHEAAKKGL